MTTRFRRLTVVLAAAVAAWLAFLQLRQPRANGTRVAPIHEPEKVALPRVGQPSEAVTALERPSASAPLVPSSDPSEAADDDTIFAASYEDALVERRARRLEARWKADPPDLEWTRSARNSVTAQMQANRVRGTLKNVDCRTTLCRVDVQFARPEDAVDLYKVQPQEGRQTYPVVTHEGNSVVVAVYVASKDVELKTFMENQVR